MIINGIARILISVRDLSESVAFYRDNFGMSEVTDYALDSATINQLWNLPPGTTGHATLLKTEEQTSLLELIEFKPHSDKFIREIGNTRDYGLFSIAFRAKNVDAACDRFKQQGYQFICPPITYTPNWVPVTVKEAIMVSPNGIPIALIERLTEPIPEFEGEFSIILDSSQTVADLDAVTQFYVDVLGLNLVFDQVLPPGMIDDILNLPTGTECRMAFINQPDSKTPLLEFIQSSVPGKYLSDVAKPPNLGLFAIVLATDDLAALVEKLQNKSTKILSGPVEIALSDHESARAIVVEAPNGVNLQFFEKID